ncbi:MAG: condensation domain-containing protein [Dehalococcoidia bacterium]|nr:condensation domain-containing protein [Dehalococcoidia bacterium]
MQRKTESSASSIPLNCVDKCLLALDSINEPMLIHVILNLEGEIDHVRLNQAIFSAQQAHPVMRTILRSRNFRLFREIQEDLGKGVLSIADQAQLQDTDHDSYLSSWMNQPLNIKKEFPVRALLLRENERESSLVFTFHHSAADGLRALLFVRKVVESYNNELSQDSKFPVDIRVNRRGDELLEFAHSQRSKVEHYYRKMISSLFHRFVIAAFPPPTRVFHDKSGKSKELRFCFTIISPKEFEQIQSKAILAGVELNHIFLAACYEVVEKWNSMHGKASNRIRIMAPVNISPKGFRYVVSNQASWFSLPTTPKDRADPAKLLRKVRADTIDETMNRIAFSLVYFFYFCSRFPLWVMRGMCRFLMISRTYVDTILFTNIGFIWPKLGSEEPAVRNIGNAKIINGTGSAPVITPMGLSIAAGIYNKNLNFSLTYRPALFSEEKARMFLDLYVEEIKNYQVGV